MTSIEIRHLALDYAVRDSLTYTSSPPADPASIVARAKAYEAYLIGGGDPVALDDTCDLCDRKATAGAAGGDLPPIAYCSEHSHLLYAENPATEPIADWELALLNAEPPPGSVAVLRSPSTGALIVAQCRTYPNAEAAWYEFDRLAPYDWSDLIAGRDIVAVHTPDGAE